MVIDGVSSSSVITKSAVVVSPVMLALLAFCKVIVPVSFASSVESSVVTTSNVAEVWPAGMVNVVVVIVVKSVPSVAVPELETYSTVTSSEDGFDKVAVKVAVPPSVTDWLPMLMPGVGSSSVITKSAVVVDPSTVALVAPLRVMVAVSVGSSVLSDVVSMVNTPEVDPVGIVSVPVVPG